MNKHTHENDITIEINPDLYDFLEKHAKTKGIDTDTLATKIIIQQLRKWQELELQP